MNSTSIRSSDGPIPEVYLESLALDVSVLDALLKRHRCNHGRAIYFRRMNMVLHRLLRREKHQDGSLSKNVIVSEAAYRLNELQKNIRDCLQKQNRENTSRKRRHNEKVEEMWDLQSLRKTKGSSSASSSALSQSGPIVQEYQDLMSVWMERIPELLSRILHASQALFVEVGRGFFLPFCTVALSALARIRTLLMEIGVRGLTEIRQLSDDIQQILPNSDNNNGDSLPTQILNGANYERCLDLFLESDGDRDIDKTIQQTMQNNDASSSKKVVFDTSALLKSMGLTEPSTKSKSKPEDQANYDDCGVPATDKGTYEEEENYFTLSSSSAPPEQYSSHSGDGNSAGMDDHNPLDIEGTGLSRIPKDSLDRNMEIVNQFQKQKKAEKHSDKKRKKTSKKAGHDSKPEALAVDAERKIKRRKSNKDSTKKKKKAKKAKNDFFDKLFD